METEDLTTENNKPKVAAKQNDKSTADSDTVTIKNLPVKQFAKIISSPKKETFVGKFEGFFYW